MKRWYNLFELSKANNNQNKVDLLEFIVSINILKPKCILVCKRRRINLLLMLFEEIQYG
jgi:hypothetical protein